MQVQAGEHEPGQVHDHRATSMPCNTTGETGVFWDRSGDRYRAVHILPNGARRQFYTTSMTEAKLFVQTGEKPKRLNKRGRHNRPSGSNMSDSGNVNEHEDGNTSNADSRKSDVELEQCDSASEVESDH